MDQLLEPLKLNKLLFEPVPCRALVIGFIKKLICIIERCSFDTFFGVTTTNGRVAKIACCNKNWILTEHSLYSQWESYSVTRNIGRTMFYKAVCKTRLVVASVSRQDAREILLNLLWRLESSDDRNFTKIESAATYKRFLCGRKSAPKHLHT